MLPLHKTHGQCTEPLISKRMELTFAAIVSDPGASEASALALVAKSTGFQRSSRLLSLRDANALVEVPKGSGSIPAGSRVSCLLLPVSNATF